jgi:mRNA interferase RelE/StbE
VIFSPAAERELSKLGTSAQRNVLRYLRERIETPLDPRRFGRALSGNRSGLWRYRVSDCRIVCRIDEGQVLILAVGHRRDIYTHAPSSPPALLLPVTNPSLETPNRDVLARQPDVAQHVVAELRQGLLRAIENEAIEKRLEPAADGSAAAFPQ